MKSNTIDAKLLRSRVAIDNAMGNAVIKEALAEFGYDETRMNAGKALYDDAESKQLIQRKEYGEQYTATDELDAAMTLGNKVYMKHVKVARIALKGQRGAAQTLDIEGRRKQTYSGWIKQATVFYTNALASEQINAALATFGSTEESLTSGKALVDDVSTKLAAQLKEKGEAQSATEARDDAFEDLEDWMYDFIKIARIALEDQPQMLEVLGIVEASE